MCDTFNISSSEFKTNFGLSLLPKPIMIGLPISLLFLMQAEIIYLHEKQHYTAYYNIERCKIWLDFISTQLRDVNVSFGTEINQGRLNQK